MNPFPSRIAASSASFPCALMGGILSVPASVRSPVVKKKNASYRAKSLSKMRPSFVATTWKPRVLPMSVRAVSESDGPPPVRFTRSCSKPEDLVKKRTFQFRLLSSSAASL